MLLLTFALSLAISPCLAYRPVVLVHGIMTGSGSMEMIQHRIQEVLEIGMDVANISAQHPEGINLLDTVWQLFYSRVGQHTSVGNYWNDPYHQSLYEEFSVYLPYINNHIPQFGYYGFNDTVVEMKGQDIYTEDRIGLKTLDESGRLHVLTVPGVRHFSWHMNVSIVDDYLLPYLD
ncbi:Lysosomal thioesterase [Operophtera brumata]|uniref:Lysosomal thioesterase n=1 Tax=Operophtera brumata TaxID=104452 RepID=A0A0L7L8G2_OPEBR|nr:Lysosomal thioesterase [Operophtera brumata]